MQTVFSLPVFAFVGSVAPDASGSTTFQDPLIVTGKSSGEQPISVELIPLFTTDALATEFRQSIQAPHTLQLKMTQHEHLIDFLQKASHRATHVAVDPAGAGFKSDRMWPIAAFLAQLKTQAEKRAGG